MIKRCIGPAIFAVVFSFLCTQTAHAAVQGYYRFPTINGDQIVFTAGGTQYAGSVKGSTMEGTSKAGGTEAKWQAIRQ